MSKSITAAALPLLMFLLSGCERLAFVAANVPTHFQHLSRSANLVYEAQGRQRLDVYAPPAATAAPVILFLHGGGWNSGSKDEYRFIGATFAKQGWVTVVPDYRLYPKVRFPAFVEDAAAALAWTRAHAAEHGGDPERIFLVGHSAGAHIAMMLALDRTFLAAQPPWLKGVIGLAGPYDFLPFTRPYMNDVFGPPERFASSQPINFARADAPPLLLIHGLADTTVRPRNSRNLAARISALGGSAELRLYEGVDHGDILAALSLPGRRRAPTLADIVRFVDVHSTEERDRSRAASGGTTGSEMKKTR